MLKVEIIAVGRLKSGPLLDLFKGYQKQLRWKLTVHEVESRYKDAPNIQADEHAKIEALLDQSSFIVVMDERGNGLKSLDFASTIQNLLNSGESKIQFIIGGADGLSDEIRGRANLLLSFGQQTWPHMLARIMLIEQIYRAQQILAGHPYHRE
jgi:23S rRNA (pseudouridine1915-N3)-methyltransferase